MKKIGMMSIIPMRDCKKNIPSKQTSAAAAIAKSRLGHSLLASRYIKGTHRVPKMQTAMRQPNVLKPRSIYAPVAPWKVAPYHPYPHSPPPITSFDRPAPRPNSDHPTLVEC